MAKTPEGEVKDYLIKHLSEIGIVKMTDALAAQRADKGFFGYMMMPSSSGIGEAGIADFLLCLQGRYIEIEVKAKKGKLSGIQKAHRDVVRAAGGDYHVVKGLKEAKMFMQFISREVLLHDKVERIAHSVRDSLDGVDISAIKLNQSVGSESVN